MTFSRKVTNTCWSAIFLSLSSFFVADILGIKYFHGFCYFVLQLSYEVDKCFITYSLIFSFLVYVFFCNRIEILSKVYILSILTAFGWVMYRTFGIIYRVFYPFASEIESNSIFFSSHVNLITHLIMIVVIVFIFNFVRTNNDLAKL